MNPTTSADQLSQSIQSDLEQGEVATIKKVAEPTIWNDPVDLGEAVVEVGRRGGDVLFHVWARQFPEDYGERLHQAVVDSRLEPARFEAELASKALAIWDGKTLTPGPKENVIRLAIPSGSARLQSWAIKAKGYANIPGANDRLCGEFMGRVLVAIDG